MWAQEGWGELASSPLHPRLADPVTVLAFDALEEGLWAGTDGGVVAELVCPALDRYCSVPAGGPVVDLCSLGESVVSLSAYELTVNASGGAPRLSWADDVGDLAAMALETRSTRMVLGRAGGGLTLFDLKLGKPVGSVDTGGRGVVALCGPTSRGALVMGSSDGYLTLLDPRSGYKPEQSLLANAGGFAALDARGDLVAATGFVNRMGRLVLDTYAKVFDVRMAPRMLASVPFAAGPSLLRFHPRISGTLLLASASGVFTLADAQGLSPTAMYQVETEGDMLTSVAISSSGECLAFGGSGGYVHLWAPTHDPAVNQIRQALVLPEPHTTLVSLSEEDPLCLAPTYFPMDASGLLSDVEPFESVAVGLPPRVVDATLLKSMRQSDFVGYIHNPHFQRGAPYGAATRAAAAQRNQRVQPRPGLRELEEARAERARRRAAAGGVMLPGRYKRVRIKQQQGVRFEEFDFSYYNRTPFTGLENDLANCYTNALLQVLFFCPPMRDALMRHVPEPSAEFSLTCEMSLLFRMLATAASGTVCQAANLLRALRQNKEAAGLGLLEGVKGERAATDIEVEAKKERLLSKRVQSLSRFLLEALNKECVAGGRPSVADAVFGLVQRQRMQCLSRPNRPEQVKEARIFQVDLQYPPPKERPAGGAGCAGGTASTPASAASSPVVRLAAPPSAPPTLALGAASAPGSPDAAAKVAAVVTAAGDASSGAARPSFAELLQGSLKVQGEMRAWFDEEVKYQYVRQTRVPKQLPTVLVINCGLQDREDLCWWQPCTVPAEDSEGRPVVHRRPWLPAAIAVTADPDSWAVSVEQAGTADELLLLPRGSPGAPARDAGAAQAAAAAGIPAGGSRVVYELTAVIAHIRDEDEADEAAESMQEYEGHLVAHIKVPPTYFDAQQQSPAGGTPHTLSRTPSEADAAVPGGAAGSGAAPGGGSAPHTPRLAGASPQEIASLMLPSAGFPAAGAVAAAAAALQRATGSGADGAGTQQAQQQQHLQQQAEQQQQQEHPERTQQQGQPPGQQQQQALSISEAEAIRQASDSLAAAMNSAHSTPPYSRPQRYNWMVFNDFHITPSMPDEVAELYGGQKAPCLLFYTQVEVVRQAAEVPPAQLVPVLSPEGFVALCRMPPLQGPKVRLHKPTFVPLSGAELPQPGSLFALDAEFVAYSPPEKALLRGVEVEARPSRLGLARVSVLRGQGPAKGTACIDDYIKSAEPVYDYLTKFSGLVPGDLDPSRSPHHLTTLKRAYLKLRYLVDCGAVFVGHGLKKDFRMINIIVPPSQIVDTVDLFHAKRSRKLSLRFLASYLLRSSIQEHTHDSIEDAATALRLYDVYQQLVREGAFEAKLQEMYDWGKRFGWEPVIWKDGQPHPAPQAPPLAASSAPPGPAPAGGLGAGHMQQQQHTQQQGYPQQGRGGQQQQRGMHHSEHPYPGGQRGIGRR
ncbi:hypothetical protein ABPG77_001677 [Micractinium sp. CCAP 211/92]